MIYADHAATTPLLECARTAMEPYLSEKFANPSALYRSGVEARRGVEMARRKIAECLGCLPNEIYFTSGGSEGNTWAVWNCALNARGGKLVVSSVEHHSLLRACESMKELGVGTELLAVDGECKILPDSLERTLARRPALVSIQYANNETGTVQNIPYLARKCHEAGAIFHTDAVQAVGHVTVGLENVDMLTASAHKFGGPKGVGFLFVCRGVRLRPLIYGGNQEEGVRGGTENVAAIAGMAAALECSVKRREEAALKLEGLEHEFRETLRRGCPEAVFHCAGAAEKLPGLVSVALPGISAERLVYKLDAAGVCVSAGAACDQRGVKSVSHVLMAMGMPAELAGRTVRFSFGSSNCPGDGRMAARALLDILSV